MLCFTLHFLLILLNGYLASGLLRRDRALISDILLFGLGLTSLAVFTNLFFLDRLSPGILLCSEAGVAAIQLLIATRWNRQVWVPVEFHRGHAAGLAILLVLMIRQPFGDWDTDALWNLKARFLAFGDGQWRNLFLEPYPWSHPDYPLGLSSVIASFWNALGSDNEWVPRLVGILFSWSAFLALHDSLERILPGRERWLVAFLLLTTPCFMWMAVRQYADIPLSAYLLLGISLAREDSRSALAASGFAFGMATFTKHEGMLYAAIFAVAAICLRSRASMRDSIKPAGCWLAGFLPGTMAWLAIRHFSPDHYFFDGSSASLWDRVTPGRAGQVLFAFGRELLDWNGWALFWPLCVLLILATRPCRADVARSRLGIFLALCLAAYAFIFLLSPTKIGWHVLTAFGRLLLQILPALFFYLALRYRGMGELSGHRSLAQKTTAATD